MKKLLSDWKNIAIIVLLLGCIGLTAGISFYFYKVGTFGAREDIGGYIQAVTDAATENAPYEKNIVERYGFPSLERMDAEGQDTLINPMQVMQKIQTLGLDIEAFKNPENTMFATSNRLDDSLRTIENTNRETVEYSGNKGSELQNLIKNNVGKDIYLNSSVIEVLSLIHI